ncbi:MAG: MotA/TolQ/ExbB proton channel family protein [Nitrospirae bacterium]|nr:MotA/TolQ/ExbB proton channel family protein [Nitrospirota bacterium]MCL5284832.1 MotA/TolQ/ExbB proton channel family protein [Nitrospirota bacterium]
MNGLAYLMKGGPIMYILLPMSGVAMAVILERYLYLRKEKIGTFEILSVLRKGALGEKEIGEIRKLLEKTNQKHLIIGKILSLFLNRRLSEGDLEHLVEAEALLEEKRLKERMWVLDTTVTMAPLLGLLGTIIGIIASFHVMSVSGLGKPAQITGGVAQALIATATGLVIAIISLGFYNHLNTTIREIRNAIESSARLLFHLQDNLRNAPGAPVTVEQNGAGKNMSPKAQPAFNTP